MHEATPLDSTIESMVSTWERTLHVKYPHILQAKEENTCFSLCDLHNLQLNMFTLSGIDYRRQILTSKVDPRAVRVEPTMGFSCFQSFKIKLNF